MLISLLFFFVLLAEIIVKYLDLRSEFHRNIFVEASLTYKSVPLDDIWASDPLLLKILLLRLWSMILIHLRILFRNLKEVLSSLI